MADGLSAVAAKALPRAIASGSWFGMREPNPNVSLLDHARIAPTAHMAWVQRLLKILQHRACTRCYIICHSFRSDCPKTGLINLWGSGARLTAKCAPSQRSK